MQSLTTDSDGDYPPKAAVKKATAGGQTNRSSSPALHFFQFQFRFKFTYGCGRVKLQWKSLTSVLSLLHPCKHHGLIFSCHKQLLPLVLPLTLFSLFLSFSFSLLHWRDLQHLWPSIVLCQMSRSHYGPSASALRILCSQFHIYQVGFEKIPSCDTTSYSVFRHRRHVVEWLI